MRSWIRSRWSASRPGAHAPDRLRRVPGCDTVGITVIARSTITCALDRGSAAHSARGFLRGAQRSSRPVVIDLQRTCSSRQAFTRSRRTSSTAPISQAEGRPGQGARSCRDDGLGQKAGVLHRRGVINSGPAASELLRELVALTNFPITSTLMGLGAYPARARTGSACSACTAPMRRTTRCTIAIS